MQTVPETPAQRAPQNGEQTVPGTVIGGRYTLRTAIGHGGMGTVWRAADTLLRRDVAVKEVLLPPGIAASDREQMYQRTLREARAAAALSHPSVIQVYDVVTEAGRPWIVMELLQSRSLAEMIIEDGPLAARAVAKIGIALLGALEVAHAGGVLHRDVKPANVLICSDGRCVLTDFGVARMPTDAQLTTPGMVLGSPHFISPERAIGAKFGPPSDLFSLGVTLYTAVEGHPPFDKRDPFETMRAIVEEEPAPPTRSGALSGVLYGLLEKDPARRWGVQSTRKVLRELLVGPLASSAAAHATDPYAVVRPAPTSAPPAQANSAPVVGGQIGGRAMLAPGESVSEAIRRRSSEDVSPSAPALAPGAGNTDVPTGAFPPPDEMPGAGSAPSHPAHSPAHSPAPVQRAAGPERPVSGLPQHSPYAHPHPHGQQPATAYGHPHQHQQQQPSPYAQHQQAALPSGAGGPAGCHPTQMAQPVGFPPGAGSAAGVYGAPTAPQVPQQIPQQAGYGQQAPPSPEISQRPTQPVAYNQQEPQFGQYATSYSFDTPHSRSRSDGKRNGIQATISRMPLWGRLAAIAVLAVVVLVASNGITKMFGDDDTPSEAQATPEASSSSTSSALEVQEYVDSRGFVVNVPETWVKNATSTYVDFTDPDDEARRLRVNVESAGGTAEAYLEMAEKNLKKSTSSCPSPYGQVDLRTDVELDGHEAAELEYTCGEGDSMRHGIWRVFVEGGKAYGFFVSVQDSRFSESQSIYEEMVDSYHLDTSTSSSASASASKSAT